MTPTQLLKAQEIVRTLELKQYNVLFIETNNDMDKEDYFIVRVRRC